MSGKSNLQWITEIIAVVAVLGIAAVGGYSLWSRSRAKLDPREELLKQDALAMAKAKAAGPSTTGLVRPRTGDALIRSKVLSAGIKTERLPKGVTIKHLNTNTNQLIISADGRWGVGIEDVNTAIHPAAVQEISQNTEATPPEGRVRAIELGNNATRHAAVWNLDEGKLTRYLSAELNKGTTAYAERDGATFGASIELESWSGKAFSPSGRRFAALHNPLSEGSDEFSTIHVWDILTGELICRFDEPRALDRLLLFPTDDSVVFSLDHALVRLNVESGEADMLRPRSAANSFDSGSVHDGLLLFAGRTGISTVSLTSKDYALLPTPPDEEEPTAEVTVDGDDEAAVLEAIELAASGGRKRKPPIRYSRATFSADGKQIIAWRQDSKADTWDVETRQPREPLQGQGGNLTPHRELSHAVGGLLPTRGVETSMQLVDVTTNKAIFTIHVPFNTVALHGLSSTGTRLVISTDQITALVVDFPGPVPRGTFDLAEAIGNHKLPATR